VRRGQRVSLLLALVGITRHAGRHAVPACGRWHGGMLATPTMFPRRVPWSLGWLEQRAGVSNGAATRCAEARGAHRSL
jgi:hypothetical protein